MKEADRSKIKMDEITKSIERRFGKEKLNIVRIHNLELLDKGGMKHTVKCPFCDKDHDIGPDGRLLLLKPVSEKTTSTKLRVIENWFTELKRLAPPD